MPSELNRDCVIPVLTLSDVAVTDLGRLFFAELKNNRSVYDYTNGEISAEYRLIIGKKSKLSKSQRDYVVKQYMKICGTDEKQSNETIIPKLLGLEK